MYLFAKAKNAELQLLCSYVSGLAFSIFLPPPPENR